MKRSLLDDIASAGRNLFSEPLNASRNPCDFDPYSPDRPASASRNTHLAGTTKITQDFISWIETYNGPKFSFIHCDFPQTDHATYFRLLHSLQKYADKIASESSHLMLWFDMEFYAVIKALLNSANFTVNPYPLIWAKARKYRPVSIKHPRYSCETAFLATRGDRPLVRMKPDHYRSHATLPGLKPEPMLSYFFSMFIDETTDFLDPTADSGTAILAAKSCGARSVFGISNQP